MNKSETKQFFSRPRSQRYIVGFLIAFFVLVTFLPDLRPGRKISLGYGWPKPSNISALAMDFKLNPAMRYTTGDNSIAFRSLPYVATVKLIQTLVPYRLNCLRLVSVLSTAVALIFLYRTAAVLFCPQVGVLFIFLLVTSPTYLEKMRSFGYIPFSNAVVSIAIYLLATTLNNKRNLLKVALLSVLCLLTLSLYVASRLVVIFAIIFFLIYIRKSWGKLLLFLALLVTPILVMDQLWGDVKYDPIEYNLTDAPWERLPIGGEKSGKPRGTFSGELLKRVQYNLNLASYYFSLKHKEFFDDGEWSRPTRILNGLYLPFFFLGLGVCLWNRRVSNIFLVLWFLVFFVVFFISARIHVRRIAFGLNPIYLMVALGLWLTFRFLSRCGYRGLGKKFAFIAPVFLLLVGSYNLSVFFFRMSRPYYSYSRNQLKKLALTIHEKGEGARAIRYNRQGEELIWGNPYFDVHFISPETIKKLEFDRINFETRKIRPRKIKEQIEYAGKEGGNILYVHFFPKKESGSEVGDCWWHFPDIQSAKDEFSGRVVVSQIPGIEEVYFMYVK